VDALLLKTFPVECCV